MATVGDYSIVGSGWFDTHDGIPEMAWLLPATVATGSRSILAYKVNVWFDNGPVTYHFRINGITVGKPKWNDSFFGLWHTIVKKGVLQAGQNVLTLDMIFGSDFEGPSAQGVGDLVIHWQNKV